MNSLPLIHARAADIDATTMQRDNALHERKADAHAAGMVRQLGGLLEEIENVGQHLRRDANAVVHPRERSLREPSRSHPRCPCEP